MGFDLRSEIGDFGDSFNAIDQKLALPGTIGREQENNEDFGRWYEGKAGENVTKLALALIAIFGVGGAMVGGGASGAAGGETAAGGFGAPYGGGEEFGAMGAAEGNAAAGGTASSAAGTEVATTPAEALSPTGTEVASNTGTQAATEGIINSGVSTPSSTPGVGDAGAFDQGGMGQGGMNYQSPADSSGLINSIMQWGSKNPVAATMLGTQVVGGIGQNITQNELMDKRTAADKELVAKKAEEERKASEHRRAMIQSGSYFSSALPFSAKTSKPLRRPDGSLVYPSNGLIGNQMGVA